jgi:glutamate/tyrosine decarboxylase-like PLP-dependent enzyme
MSPSNLSSFARLAATNPHLQGALDWSGAGSDALGAWFLGPKAENEELLKELVNTALCAHVTARRDFHKGDPDWLTPARKESQAYKDAITLMRKELETMCGALDASVPFYSYRYQGHMLWDVTLPSVAGYIAALLYNQNNVAAEASPVTTWYEMLVGEDLCRMLGFHVPTVRDPVEGKYKTDAAQMAAWGHITCGGTVANVEALWAARNAKFFALAAQAAVRKHPELYPALKLEVTLASGRERPFEMLSAWELLNLPADAALRLPAQIAEVCNRPPAVVDALLAKHSLQHRGLASVLRDLPADVADPVVLAPSTAHYSWPKAAAVLGLGRDQVLPIVVDLDARLSIDALRTALQRCLDENRPVLMVVAVLGTTEQSAVDPVRRILSLREEFRKQGLDFWLHVDAAWGGYFASMLREPAADAQRASVARFADLKTASELTEADANELLYGPEIVMSPYVRTQYQALNKVDSITIDPHKAGYAPYPAGGLCYRNSAMRHLVAFTAPVVYHGGVDPTVGVYGLEGSKPGAAAAGVYLSHRVIRTDQSGYGRILGRCLWNSMRFYCAVLGMAQPEDTFRVVAMQRLPTERRQASAKRVQKERARIAALNPLSNHELIAHLNDDPKALRWFRKLGSDLLIVSYAFNKEGNRSLAKMNEWNQAIFAKLSVSTRHEDLPATPLFVTASQLDVKTCGQALYDDFKRRLGIKDPSQEPIHFLISTTMDPWLTDTERGNLVPELIDRLREVVREVISP